MLAQELATSRPQFPPFRPVHAPALLRFLRDAPAKKHQAVERWVARRLGAIEHEKRVAAIATRLFHLTQALHQMRPADLHLLRLACLVHDVGRCIKNRSHPRQGARMLMADAHLPLTAAERRLLAYLTRHHRRRFPEMGADLYLHPADDRSRPLQLLALLRAADGLDSRSQETPIVEFDLHRTARRAVLRVDCTLNAGSPRACRVYGRRKKFRLLEKALGLRVDLHVSVDRTLRRAA